MAWGTLPIIGYDNLLTNSGATVTADGSNDENAYDWNTCDYWTTGAASGYIQAVFGANQKCNYFAFAAHDLHDNTGTIKLQYWTGVAYADIPGASSTPSDGSTVMLCFDDYNTTRYKVVVSCAAACKVGVIAFGERMQLERGVKPGFTSPILARNDKLYPNVSERGHLLGMSLVRSGVSGSLELADMTDSFVRITLNPFLEHQRTGGWFLLWNPDTYPGEAAYCWPAKANARPKYSREGFQSISIAYGGLVDDPIA